MGLFQIRWPILLVKLDLGGVLHRSTGLKSRAPKTTISLNYANAQVCIREQNRVYMSEIFFTCNLNLFDRETHSTFPHSTSRTAKCTSS